jgi:hypothetical protein
MLLFRDGFPLFVHWLGTTDSTMHCFNIACDPLSRSLRELCPVGSWYLVDPVVAFQCHNDVFMPLWQGYFVGCKVLVSKIHQVDALASLGLSTHCDLRGPQTGGERVLDVEPSNFGGFALSLHSCHHCVVQPSAAASGFLRHGILCVCVHAYVRVCMCVRPALTVETICYIVHI